MRLEPSSYSCTSYLTPEKTTFGVSFASLKRSSLAFALLTMLILMSAPMPAMSQTQIEDLERKLEQARERKLREAQQPARPQRPDVPVNSGRIVVGVDVACDLRVNGEQVRILQAGDTVTIAVPAGEQLIECLSRTFQGVKVRKVMAIERGKQSVLTLELQALEEASRQSADEAQARASAEAELRAVCARGVLSMMEPTEDRSVLKQCGTGLLWTRSDSDNLGRGNLNWMDAMNYCRRMGDGWTLPTVKQLQSIYDTSLQGVYCNTGARCKVSDQFDFGRDYHWFWSSDLFDASGDQRAWYVSLVSGDQSSSRVTGNYRKTALCVRRP